MVGGMYEGVDGGLENVFFWEEGLISGGWEDGEAHLGN